MYPLTTAEAIRMVRKNFDEQETNGSSMMDIDDIDSNEFESLLMKTLPEAINEVHMNAPANILDGETLSSTDLESATISGAVLSFGTKKEVMRLVCFKASDSPYVVSELIPEYSYLGRMQLNPYARGSYDNPKLVILQGKSEDYLSSFKYYTLNQSFATPAQAIERFEYLPRYKYVELNAGSRTYKVAENVVENVIDTLTGMMMAIYGMTEQATYFMTKGSFGQPEQSATPTE